MESALLANALRLVVSVSVPILVAIGIGALIAGFLRVATQIDDAAISFIGKFAALGVLLMWGSSLVVKQVAQFTLRLWSGPDFFH